VVHRRSPATSTLGGRDRPGFVSEHSCASSSCVWRSPDLPQRTEPDNKPPLGRGCRQSRQRARHPRAWVNQRPRSHGYGVTALGRRIRDAQRSAADATGNAAIIAAGNGSRSRSLLDGQPTTPLHGGEATPTSAPRMRWSVSCCSGCRANTTTSAGAPRAGMGLAKHLSLSARYGAPKSPPGSRSR